MDFSPGVNVIVGASDQGKSAIVRAIRWLFFNEPRGSDFVRVGSTGPCRVEAELDDGTMIVRERSGTRNVYELYLPTGEKRHFEGFGTEIPVEILKAHGIRKVSLDDQLEVALSLSSQLEAPFLLTQPGSVRAKAIGRISGVHVLDLAIKLAAREQSSVEDASAQIESDLEKIRLEMENYRDLPEEEARIERLNDLLKRLKDLRANVNTIIQSKRELAEVTEQMSQSAAVIAATARVKDCSSILLEIGSVLSRLKGLKALKALVDELRAIEKSIEAGHDYMKRFSTLESAQELANRIGDAPKRLSELKRLRAELQKNESERTYVEAEKRKANQEAKRLVNEYAEALRAAGKCPVCMSDITSTTIEHIINELRLEGSE